MIKTKHDYEKAIDKIAGMTKEIEELRHECLTYIVNNNDTVDTSIVTAAGNRGSYVNGCVVTSVDTEALKKFWTDNNKKPIPTKESIRKATFKIIPKKEK